ncbi:dioxygenase [Pseudidiomarina aestuarii]|uniref:Dioxygenase n=1 Tax=Pseudidiomarina aestuarii TaxID=624146 RepID=A0A7Z6ZSA0_9GAMM|nr:class III extradiol ring-cleavage dioxygenase [Pseudidiomarina aestuarii]RUO39466.1 dioxygenase [Pseudidiomarina aestuarii]
MDVAFISHGGGPLPLLGDARHREMREVLADMRRQLRQPEAIIVISAHWEAQQPTITAAQSPSLLYDYTGFPPESYAIQYPSPGAPELALELQAALAGFEPQLDAERGLDHGVFVPLKLMYPEADIPVVQVSLMRSLDPDLHLQLGEALALLRHRNILVLGSGFSFHNMRAFFNADSVESDAKNLAFEDWLVDSLTAPQYSHLQRWQRLKNWEQAPYARFCHPREEHLLPLHVCFGLTQRAPDQFYRPQVLNKRCGMFLWLAA